MFDNQKIRMENKEIFLMETKNEFRVVVIGGDHYNTYGIVRSLGEQNIMSDVLILGHRQKGSFVLKSKFVANGFLCQNHGEAIEYLSKYYDCTTKNIVICCSDEAEEMIIDHYHELSNKFILPVCEDPHKKCYRGTCPNLWHQHSKILGRG